MNTQAAFDQTVAAALVRYNPQTLIAKAKQERAINPIKHAKSYLQNMIDLYYEANIASQDADEVDFATDTATQTGRDVVNFVRKQAHTLKLFCNEIVDFDDMLAQMIESYPESVRGIIEASATLYILETE